MVTFPIFSHHYSVFFFARVVDERPLLWYSREVALFDVISLLVLEVHVESLFSLSRKSQFLSFSKEAQTPRLPTFNLFF